MCACVKDRIPRRTTDSKRASARGGGERRRNVAPDADRKRKKRVEKCKQQRHKKKAEATMGQAHNHGASPVIITVGKHESRGEIKEEE
jgi:hypothetical protein